MARLEFPSKLMFCISPKNLALELASPVCCVLNKKLEDLPPKFLLPFAFSREKELGRLAGFLEESQSWPLIIITSSCSCVAQS